MDFKKLLTQAKALGIKNSESLDVEALQVAIDSKKQENEAKAKKTPNKKTPVKPITKAKADADAKAKANADAKAKADADAKANTNSNDETFEVDVITNWLDQNGDKWAFTKNAPKKLNWDGEIRTQQEILLDDSIMKKLTIGHYSFIKRIR